MNISTRAGILICAAAAILSADTLTLRNGETVRGTYLGGTARQVRIDADGDIRTFNIGEVKSVTFTDPAPPQASTYPRDQDRRDQDRRDQDRRDQAPRDQAAPDQDRRDQGDRDYARNTGASNDGPANYGATLPVDTSITIRMIDAVNSETARLGQTFRASIDEPVVVDGRELVPRGADVLTKLVSTEQSGKIEGRTTLTLALSTITVNGRPVDVNSTDVQTASGSRGERSAKVVGGTAALGALIGAIAGGGKGAAIGAGSGAAVGAGAQVLTGGQKVKIPSETRLTFRLQSPVQL